MYAAVVTKDPTAVEVEVQTAYRAMFSGGDRTFVPQVFGWAIDCFTGQCEGYQPIDARYHDFEHTLQGALCMARLLRGFKLAGARPELTERLFQLGILAILLHDTGYLKKRGDDQGTGAKYTAVHVRRSADFAGEFLGRRHFPIGDTLAVQNMIQCTGLNAPLDAIPFQSELERVTGFALGTSDLLGQMAAEDYVDKLPVLYAEFAEAVRHAPDKAGMLGMFGSARDLMQETPAFWESYVRPKLDRDFRGLYRYLNQPYPAGANDYLERIETNMDRLRRELALAQVAARGD